MRIRTRPKKLFEGDVLQTASVVSAATPGRRATGKAEFLRAFLNKLFVVRVKKPVGIPL